MKDEVDIMKQLTVSKHPNIIQMFESFETKHILHIVMELCTGGELFDRIKKKGYYREEEAKPLIRKICEAVHFMHDKHRVVHCNLKPDDILFMTDAEDSDIKIIDFGMAKVLKRLDSLRPLCGTPYYTAPEVIKGDYAHPSDMWSVGVIAYTMIFAMVPFYVNPNRYYGTKETKEIYKLILKGFQNEVKKKLGPWFPEKKIDRLGEVGRDFMVKLMEKDVARRLTAKEALQHEWLELNSVKSVLRGVFEAETPSDEMNQVTAQKYFTYAVMELFDDHCGKIESKLMEGLNAQFATFDNKNDGTILYDDFERVIGENVHLDLEIAMIRCYCKLLYPVVRLYCNSETRRFGLGEIPKDIQDVILQFFGGLNGMDIGRIDYIDLINKINDDNVHRVDCLRYSVCELTQCANYVVTLNMLQMEILMNFATAKDFKYVIATVLRKEYVNERNYQWKEWKKLFASLDNDGDGRVSYTDFETGILGESGLDLILQKGELRKIFSALDIDDDGYIAFEDMLNAAVHDYLVQSDARLEKAFVKLKERGDGKIVAKDLKTRIKEMSLSVNADILLKLNQLIDNAASDDDGIIHHQEFMCLTHPEFEKTDLKDSE